MYKKNKGVALILVLLITTVLTMISVELLYSIRVQASIAKNNKDDVRAKYLAYGALKFAKLFLKFDLSVGDQIAKITQSLDLSTFNLEGVDPATLHIWDFMPISYPPPISAFAMILNTSISEEETLKPGESFDVDIEDESVKININALRDEKPAENNKPLTWSLLYNLFNEEEFNDIFKNESTDIKKKIVDNILDWIDNDYEAVNGGNEEALYLEEGYRVKNNKFDSIKELGLISEFKDAYMSTFEQYLTCFGDNKINVKAASKQIILTFFNDKVQDKKEKADTIINSRATKNFKANDFLKVYTQELGGKQPQDFFLDELIKKSPNYITTKSTKFKVKVTATVADTNKTLVAIYDRGKMVNEDLKLYYLRIE
jgi:type II secretory pathway component PulK